MKTRLSFICAAIAACLIVAACATTDNVFTESERLFREGRPDEALTMLRQAADAHPDDRAYRVEYLRRRDFVLAQWLGQADTLRTAGQYDPAAVLYQRVLGYDNVNPRAKAGLTQVDVDRRHAAVIAQAEDLIRDEKFREAGLLLRPVLSENPGDRGARRLQRIVDEKMAPPAVGSVQLKPLSTQPISLELKDVPVRTVFDVIGKAVRLNFLFDRDIRPDQRTSVTVRDATPEDLIRLVLTTNGLEQKVLNENTALIYPNTAQKMREYQELVVKSFYVSNADIKQTANLIRTILKTRDIFVDEKLNMLVMKDVPNNIRMAEKLIAAQDLADPEVMLEVEVLEVGYNRLMNIGLQWPSSVAWSLAGGGTTTTTSTPTTGGTGSSTTTSTAGTPGVLSLTEWLNRNAGLVRLTVSDPLFALNLQQQDGSTNLLANPRIRVQNRQKARVLIGERVPVITTTAAATGGFLSQSVSYLDVGLKLEVEPLIHMDDEVTIKMGLEVSSISNTVQTSGGTVTYQIGTRNANTVLRLRDGETQVLAGLINDEDRRSANKVPGLGDLPVVSRLFGAHRDSNTRTEIILLITPRLVRSLTRPEARNIEFAAGTESATVGSAVSAVMGPALPLPEPTPTPVQPAIPSSPPPANQSTPQGPAGAPTGPDVSSPGSSSPLIGPQMVPFGGVGGVIPPASP